VFDGEEVIGFAAWVFEKELQRGIGGQWVLGTTLLVVHLLL
jgi:hypothetical protein